MIPQLSEKQSRLYEKLHDDLGSEIISFLHDKVIHEIILNPDGFLWVDSERQGLTRCSELKPSQAFSIINAVAGIHNVVVTQQCPRLEAELPHFRNMKGERFTAQIPPVVKSPSFTIRKKSEDIIKINDYVDHKRLTEYQANVLKELIRDRKNILVCGGPGSGKTTMTTALIAEAVQFDRNQRFVILEDLPELRCRAANQVSLLTSEKISMTDLLRTAMRMRPDRILIGEVRGKEALDVLKAWNTGCPGGICTVHANGAQEAVQRILDLSMEAGLSEPPRQLLLQTVNAVVSIGKKQNNKGFVQEIVALRECNNEKFLFEKLA